MAKKATADKLQILNEQHKEALIGEVERMQKLLASIPDAEACGLECQQYRQGALDGIAASEKLLDTYFPGWRRRK